MWRTLIDFARGTIDVHGLRDGHAHLDPLLDRFRSTAIDFGFLAGCGRRLLSDAQAVGSHPTPSGRTGSVRRVECLSVLFGELFCFGAQRGCEVDFTTVQNDLAGFDACFNCLGTSAFRMSETEYRRVSYDFPLAAARALLIANPDLVLTYVSGVGTDGTGTTHMMWHASRARRRTRCWRCHHAPTCSARVRPSTARHHIEECVVRLAVQGARPALSRAAANCATLRHH